MTSVGGGGGGLGGTLGGGGGSLGGLSRVRVTTSMTAYLALQRR